MQTSQWSIACTAVTAVLLLVGSITSPVHSSSSSSSSSGKLTLWHTTEWNDFTNSRLILEQWGPNITDIDTTKQQEHNVTYLRFIFEGERPNIIRAELHWHLPRQHESESNETVTPMFPPAPLNATETQEPLFNATTLRFEPTLVVTTTIIAPIGADIDFAAVTIRSIPDQDITELVHVTPTAHFHNGKKSQQHTARILESDVKEQKMTTATDRQGVHAANARTAANALDPTTTEAVTPEGHIHTVKQAIVPSTHSPYKYTFKFNTQGLNRLRVVSVDMVSIADEGTPYQKAQNYRMRRPSKRLPFETTASLRPGSTLKYRFIYIVAAPGAANENDGWAITTPDYYFLARTTTSDPIQGTTSLRRLVVSAAGDGFSFGVSVSDAWDPRHSPDKPKHRFYVYFKPGRTMRATGRPILYIDIAYILGSAMRQKNQRLGKKRRLFRSYDPILVPDGETLYFKFSWFDGLYAQNSALYSFELNNSIHHPNGTSHHQGTILLVGPAEDGPIQKPDWHVGSWETDVGIDNTDDDIENGDGNTEPTGTPQQQQGKEQRKEGAEKAADANTSSPMPPLDKDSDGEDGSN